MIRISCVKPERVIELFDGKKVKGITFHLESQMGFIVTLRYEDTGTIEEDEIEGKIKSFMKEDEIFRGLIVSVEMI